ncbi:MAG: hypothetical protein N2559_05020 [Anaerolineae bacterium]|nr:hypothetical protein [Anaerolineae bacterium]
MPMTLADFPRPAGDNGRGLHGSALPGWTGGDEGYDYWIRELVEMGIKWFKVVDDGGDSLPWCEKLLDAGIFPIVRILRRDPPPNDTPEPNPGHIGAPEEQTIRRLIAAGVRYFETNNEPNLPIEWKHNAMPANPIECAKLVALNWLFDARLILSLGGLPGLPAISNGGKMDLMGALVTLGREDILLEGCWIAVHNFGGNRPLNFPDDPVNRSGQPLTRETYDHGAFTTWVWWNTVTRRADTLDEINAARANQANPAAALENDHACWREFEYYHALAMKYLGRPIPIIATSGGYQIGRRNDLRYPRVTPEVHRDLTVALFDFMQRQAPDYFFAATPWLAFDYGGYDADAWFGAFWQDALTHGSGGHNNLPTITVPNHNLGERLPVIDAVKALLNLARRLPGTQPAPPAPIVVVPPEPAAPAQPTQPTWAVWLRDEPPARVNTQYAVSSRQEAVAVGGRQEAGGRAREETVEAPAELPRESTPARVEIETPREPMITREEKIETPIETPREATPIRDETSAPPPIEFGAPEKLAPPETIAPSESIAREMPAPLALPIGDEVEWDWRLDALNVTVEPAQVESGLMYWKLVRAVYQGPGESNDTHQIVYTVVNERNEPIEYQKVKQGWSDGETDALTNEHGEARIPLWLGYAPDRDERGAYSAWVDGLPSDRVVGLGLPAKRHVSFLLTWRRTVAR